MSNSGSNLLNLLRHISISVQYFSLGFTSFSWKRMIKTSHTSALPERELLFSEMKHFLNNLEMTHPSPLTGRQDYYDVRRVNFQENGVNISTDLVLLLTFFLSLSQHLYEFCARVTHLPKD